MAVVFQDYSRSLMPWLTGRATTSRLPLRSAGVPKAERLRARHARRWPRSGWPTAASRTRGSSPAACSSAWPSPGRWPSGPHAIVMDEPFASVDAQTRADLEDLVLQVRERPRHHVLLVTHDIDEAVYLADRVLVLSGKPASVAALIPVDLPAPRDQLSTKALPAFAELRSPVYTLIRKPPAAGAGQRDDERDGAPVSAGTGA